MNAAFLPHCQDCGRLADPCTEGRCDDCLPYVRTLFATRRARPGDPTSPLLARLLLPSSRRSSAPASGESDPSPT